MKFHSDLFGWEYVWRNFADEKGGETVESREGSELVELSIPVPGIEATVTFTPVVHQGRKKHRGTTAMLPFEPDDAFIFAIQTEKWIDQVGKAFGLQDVQVQDQLFDSQFLIQGNEEQKIRSLFTDLRLRELLLLQPPSQLRVITDSSQFDPEWFVPEGLHTIVYRQDALLEKIDQLQNVYDILTCTLQQLGALGSVRGRTATTSRPAAASEEVSASGRQRLRSPLLEDV